MSSSSATSLAFHFSTSRRMSTARWRAGRCWSAATNASRTDSRASACLGRVAVGGQHAPVGHRPDPRALDVGRVDVAVGVPDRRDVHRQRAPLPALQHVEAHVARDAVEPRPQRGATLEPSKLAPRGARASPAPRPRPRTASRACGSSTRSARRRCCSKPSSTELRSSIHGAGHARSLLSRLGPAPPYASAPTLKIRPTSLKPRARGVGRPPRAGRTACPRRAARSSRRGRHRAGEGGVGVLDAEVHRPARRLRGRPEVRRVHDPGERVLALAECRVAELGRVAHRVRVPAEDVAVERDRASYVAGVQLEPPGRARLRRTCRSPRAAPGCQMPMRPLPGSVDERHRAEIADGHRGQLDLAAVLRRRRRPLPARRATRGTPTTGRSTDDPSLFFMPPATSTPSLAKLM